MRWREGGGSGDQGQSRFVSNQEKKKMHGPESTKGMKGRTRRGMIGLQ